MTPRVLRTAIALAVLAITATACSHDHPRANPRSALFIGDSLMSQSQGQVKSAAQRAGWTPTVEGRFGAAITGGFTISSWPPEIANLVKISKPAVAVIELGTDGCGLCLGLDKAIDDDMKRLRDVPRVYWVNV